MNTKILMVARKAAERYKCADGYGQAAEIITMLCEEIEKNEKSVSTQPTVKDVLLERWAQETNDMAEFMVVELPEIGKWVSVNERGSEIGQYRDRYRAIAAQIAYLNSAAEVGK